MYYSQAIQFLYELRLFGMKLGLENTQRLAAEAGNPQERLRFIHVAGTNGKGSTCAMLESIYRAAGLRVGLFTSPHLVSFTERIQVNRRRISQEDVARGVEEMRERIQSLGAEAHPTFFEAVTVLALDYFAREKCDLVVWETGLGGRLDATNIVTPLASVITNVQLDHQQWLGNTAAEIAREKGGIIKPGVPVLTATDDAAALSVISEIARSQPAPLTVVGRAEIEGLEGMEVSLAGEHQKVNAALALAVARVLAGTIPVTEEARREGLATTEWAGRLQTVERAGGQIVLLDGAHNPAGAQTLAAALGARFGGRRPALILGTMRDKDCAGICEILAPLAGKIYLAQVASERAADPELLAGLCRRSNAAAPALVCGSVGEALALTDEEPLVVVAGSIHFVGEAMEALGLAAPSPERGLNEYGASFGRQALPASVRAVTFDVGGTLIEPWPSVGQVYAEVAARHGVRAAAEDLDRQFAAAWRAKKDFDYSREGWRELVNETFANLTAGPPSASLFTELYRHFGTAAPWRVFEDVGPCLRGLKERGLKLGIISNWDDRLRPLLRALELDGYFYIIIVSSEVGRRKPDPEMFRAAARELGTVAAAVRHVGHFPEEDCAGGRWAGMQTVWLQRAGQGKAPEVRSLDFLIR